MQGSKFNQGCKAFPKKISTKKVASNKSKEEDGSTGKQSAGKNIDNNMVEAKKFATIKMENLNPRNSDSIQKTTKLGFTYLQLNQLLQKKSKLSIQGTICWKMFLFPSHCNISLVSQKTHQYFGLDLVEEASERTFWTHEASVWHGLFESVQDIAQTGQVESISDLFNGTLACIL